MSITRKGMKIMKPIWNAVFSSLVTKAGTSTRIGTCSALADSPLSSLARRANRPDRLARLLEHEPRIGSLGLARAPARTDRIARCRA
jgi:hypothetical protein